MTADLPEHQWSSRSCRKIVVLRAGQIGDFLLAIPAFRALRAAFPAAQISYIGLPRIKPLAERFPTYIDRFVEFPGFPGLRERLVEPSATLEFFAWAQREHYDLAFQWQGSGVFSNPFVKLLGARFTVGFVRQEDSPLFLGLDRHVVHQGGQHETLKLLDLLSVVGVPEQGRDSAFPLWERDWAELERVLAAAGVERDRPLIGVHPGGRFPDRRWPPERFAMVADRLAARLGAVTVITGGPRERALTSAVLARMRQKAYDLAGQLSLGALAALLMRLAVYITNDTGPAHLAYALGVPSVTVFGAASPDEWGPLNRRLHRVVAAVDACHPCIGEGCIGRITAESVLAEAEQLLGWSPGMSRA